MKLYIPKGRRGEIYRYLLRKAIERGELVITRKDIEELTNNKRRVDTILMLLRIENPPLIGKSRPKLYDVAIELKAYANMNGDLTEISLEEVSKLLE